MPALFSAFPGIAACFGRTRMIAATTCAGTPSIRCANASSPAATWAVVASPIDPAGLLGSMPPAESHFREHQRLLGPRAGRDGVVADPQGWPQGRPRSSGRAPGLLPPRQLPRSVDQPHRAERGRGAQRYPHIDRLPGHPRGPRPYAASPVGCALVLVPRQSLLNGSRSGHDSARSRSRWVLNLPPALTEPRGRRQRCLLASTQPARRDVGSLRARGHAPHPGGPLLALCPRHVAGAPFWPSVFEVSDV